MLCDALCKNNQKRPKNTNSNFYRDMTEWLCFVEANVSFVCSIPGCFCWEKIGLCSSQSLYGQIYRSPALRCLLADPLASWTSQKILCHQCFFLLKKIKSMLVMLSPFGGMRTTRAPCTWPKSFEQVDSRDIIPKKSANVECGGHGKPPKTLDYQHHINHFLPTIVFLHCFDPHNLVISSLQCVCLHLVKRPETNLAFKICQEEQNSFFFEVR